MAEPCIEHTTLAFSGSSKNIICDRKVIRESSEDEGVP